MKGRVRLGSIISMFMILVVVPLIVGIEGVVDIVVKAREASAATISISRVVPLFIKASRVGFGSVVQGIQEGLTWNNFGSSRRRR